MGGIKADFARKTEVYDNCNEEISKCDEGLLISTLSGGENLSGIFKDKSEKSITT